MRAAIVVIMMGRKRTIAPSIDGIHGALPFIPFRLQGKVDHHDGIFLDNADEHDDTDEGIEVKVFPEDKQGDERPETGRREAGQNGEGMDIALVEDPQHDVDHQDGHDEEQREPLGGGLVDLGGSLKAGGDGGGKFPWTFSRSAETASPSGTPGLRLKEMVTAVIWPRWFTENGPSPGFRVAEGSQRHLLAGIGADVEEPEGGGIHPVLRQEFHDDLILVGGRIDGGDLTGAIGVVERILDLLGVTPRLAARLRSISRFTWGFLICRSLVTS